MAEMTETPQRLWVPATDQWWEPTPESPDLWWRTVEPCDDTCHHPVHAFGAPRRRHIEDAAWIARNGTETKPEEASDGS